MTKPLNKANSAAAKVTTSNGNGALNRLGCRDPLFMRPKLNVCHRPRWHPSEVTAANEHAFFVQHQTHQRTGRQREEHEGEKREKGEDTRQHTREQGRNPQRETKRRETREGGAGGTRG